jgi:hypothetical protein
MKRAYVPSAPDLAFALAIALLALALPACGAAASAEGGPVSATRLRSADPQANTVTPPVGSGDGVAPRAAQLDRTSSGPEDTSKKSVALETAAYTDSDHVTVFTPAISGTIENVVDGATLSGSYLVDVVSAASVDIIATASRRWHEVRHAGTLSARYKPRDLGIGFSASTSSEPDYFSYGASGNVSYDLDEKNTSLFLGYGYSHDTSGRGGTPFTTFARSLQRGSFLLGFDQVIGPATLATLSFSAIIENGDQSKPYRYIPMFSPVEGANVPQGASIDYVNAHRLFERPLEQLPLARRRFALAFQIAHRLESSTFRANQRLYVDNWGAKATTTDARWIFDVADRLRLWPHFRFHAQTRSASGSAPTSRRAAPASRCPSSAPATASSARSSASRAAAASRCSSAPPRIRTSSRSPPRPTRSTRATSTISSSPRARASSDRSPSSWRSHDAHEVAPRCPGSRRNLPGRRARVGLRRSRA